MVNTVQITIISVFLSPQSFLFIQNVAVSETMNYQLPNFTYQNTILEGCFCSNNGSSIDDCNKHIHVSVCLCVSVCLSLCVCVYLCVCVSVSVCACISVQMSASVHACICAYVCVVCVCM